MYGTFYLHSFKKDAEERIDILESCARLIDANPCTSKRRLRSSDSRHAIEEVRRVKSGGSRLACVSPCCLSAETRQTEEKRHRRRKEKEEAR